VGVRRAGAPVLSGSVPPLAGWYNRRTETGFGLADALRPGETIVLAPALPDEDADQEGAPAGTGKTQLAAGFAHALWDAGALDLLVWVPAVSRTSIVAGLAQAAADADAEYPGETADESARRFLGWLGRTRRRWAVVLDDVTSAADVEGLWPQGGTGQVVVTTRLSQGELGVGGRTVLAMPGFSLREALGYLNSRLTAFPDQRIEALDLAEDTGGLPLSLAQAAAVVAGSEMTCRDYRVEYASRLRDIKGTVVDGCAPSTLATWSLAVEAAHALPPAGLAWPALALAAMLGPCGIPGAVLMSAAACRYVTGRSMPGADDQDLVRATFANLESLGLLSVDKASAARTVWVHPAIQAAVRAYLPPGDIAPVVAAAASALLEAWPEAGAAGARQLGHALLDCAASLRGYAGDLLWQPTAHPLLLRAGNSLLAAALTESAIGYWQSIATACNTRLGRAHVQSAMARDRLSAAYAAAGRMAQALPLFETALADRESGLGAEHPDTVTARVNLARCQTAAGRQAEAIALFEQALGQSERLFGVTHKDTLAVRADLAAAYRTAGRPGDSVALYERTLAECEGALGPAHRDTMKARGSLAAAYQAAGRMDEAIGAYARTLADRERAQGQSHPDAVAARASLANACRVAGRLKEAIPHYERVLADRERIQGGDHPETMTARSDLAMALRGAGKLKAAIALHERALADRERVQGPDHRDCLRARADLAATYQLGRRLRDAISQYERVVADSERLLGPGDVETLTARCELAAAYRAAGRDADAMSELRRALADSEQHLGRDHPMTGTVRGSLGSGLVPAGSRAVAAEHEDHAPGGWIVEHGRLVEIAVTGGDRVAASKPDGGGHLRRRPEPVGHHVGHGPHRPVGPMGGDAHVLGGDLAYRVDPVLMAAPAHLGADAALLDRPLAARPRHRGEIVRGVCEFEDVQAAGILVSRHRGQVRHQVVEREQVADGIQHGNREVETARDAEVPHVRLDDVKFEPGGLGPCRRVGAHCRRPVERRRP
jgi:tetratricopeptide (TPR) repeat protein